MFLRCSCFGDVENCVEFFYQVLTLYCTLLSCRFLRKSKIQRIISLIKHISKLHLRTACCPNPILVIISWFNTTNLFKLLSELTLRQIRVNRISLNSLRIHFPQNFIKHLLINVGFNHMHEQRALFMENITQMRI